MSTEILDTIAPSSTPTPKELLTLARVAARSAAENLGQETPPDSTVRLAVGRMAVAAWNTSIGGKCGYVGWEEDDGLYLHTLRDGRIFVYNNGYMSGGRDKSSAISDAYYHLFDQLVR